LIPKGFDFPEILLSAAKSLTVSTVSWKQIFLKIFVEQFDEF